MRTHQQIVQEHGASNLYRDLRALGVEITPTTTQRWADRDNIPGEYWAAVVHVSDKTSLDELASSAEAKKLPETAELRRAAAGEAAA